MEYGIISCIPIAVLIIGALITKKMPEMIILSSLIGAILVYKQGFFSNYLKMIYASISNESFQFLLMILLGFGGMIKLFEKSGALLGFSDIIGKFANTRKKSLFVTWIMGIIMFVDDYLNVLAVSFSMKETTDRNRIPREHLAYGVNSMGACVCVLIPFTSWASFAVGCMGEQGLTFSDYLRALPYMFFPWIAILVCLLVGLGILPKVGLLKKAYERVDAGGPLLVEEKVGASIVNMGSDDAENVKSSSPLNFFIPIIALVAGMFLCGSDVVSGILIALAVQLVLYLAQRIMTLTEFMDTLFEGITSMVPLSIVICFAYVLNIANTEMGFAEFLIGGMQSLIPESMYAAVPAFVFIIVSLVAFAAASFWVLILITIPIFVPLSMSLGLDPALVIAAVMSGVAFGSKFCFYSDAVFMTSAGTGISNMTQIKVVAPYILGSAVLSVICFAAAGIISMS